MEHFIQTSDEEVAKELRANGYIELTKNGRLFCFINESSKKANFDEKKVIYTNNLCV